MTSFFVQLRRRHKSDSMSRWPDRLSVLVDAVHTSLWAVPLLMVLAACILWWVAGRIDARLDGADVANIGWLHSGSGDDARNLLSTLVTAIITIASIVFSITIVTLTLAANQFGSRLVRTYMSDLGSKLSLGLFVMTVIYTLLALRSVRQDMPPDDVPHVTVTLALLLGVTCVLVLVLFLHNIARSIVADEVIRRVSGELEEAVAQLPAGASPARPAPAVPTGGALIRSSEEGYVQAVRFDALLELAVRHDVLICLTFKPGDFMCQGGWLAHVHPPERAGRALADAIQEAVLIGPLRTPTQDLEYSMRHLIDIALRALSPGINDANTAMVVIDRLRGAISSAMGKCLPPAVHEDEAGTLRVLGPAVTHADLVDYGFDQIRRSAAGQPAVVIRLLVAMGRIAEHARLPEQLGAVERQCRAIAADGGRQACVDSDAHAMGDAFASALSKIAAVRKDAPAMTPGSPADALRPRPG